MGASPPGEPNVASVDQQWAKRIREARTDANLSQMELGEKAKVSQTLISMYERGAASPNAETRQRIEQVLGVTVEPEKQTDSNDWGRRMREARLGVGLSQTELGDKVQVRQTLISGYERGAATPSEETRRRIEQVLGITADTAGIDTSGIGLWVSRERSLRKWTVGELAERAGVSAPSIYNIESGRTPNPRKETIDRIQHAFQAKAPEELTEHARDEASISGTGIGAFTGFDPYDIQETPSVSGVYVLYDVSDRPIYVGQSNNIRKRIRQHDEKFWFKRPIVHMAAYVEIGDETLRRQVEQVLIRFLKSNAVINKQNVEKEE